MSDMELMKLIKVIFGMGVVVAMLIMLAITAFAIWL